MIIHHFQVMNNMEESIYHELEQPSEIPIREREDAMGSYLMMFGALAVGLPLPIINLLAAVIYYALNAKKSRFIKFHSLQSLLSQLPTTLMNAGLIFWTVYLFFSADHLSSEPNLENFSATNIYWGYVITTIIANLLYIVFSFIGAIKARKGEMYYFIFFGKLSYHLAYKKSHNDRVTPQNKPPMA